MNQIRISDVTMKQTGKEISLSFKEKIELSKLLDKLGVSVIELEPIAQPRIDALRIKSIAAAVKDSILAVPVALNADSVAATWNALKEAKKARLQVCAPVSPVQMEYLFHKKPEAMLTSIRETLAECLKYCADVEFIADDATRSDTTFLYDAVRAAIEAGAKTVTVCDTAGSMLPNEFTAFIRALYANVPELKEVTLGISCSDNLSMADSCAIAAIRYGAGEIKAAAYRQNLISLPNVAKVLKAKGDVYNVSCAVRTTELKRITDQIAWMCQTGRSKNSPFDNGVQDEDGNLYLTSHDDLSAVMKVVAQLGYDLSEEDGKHVYDAFLAIASRKERELLKVVEYPEKEVRFERKMIEMYKYGRLSDIAYFVKAPDNQTSLSFSDYKVYSLRNKQWVKRLQPYLREGKAFITLNAMYLGGEDGLLARLREAGYRVKAVNR